MNDKTAVVLGVGRMGIAIAWAMDKLGYRVIGMDANPTAGEHMPLGTEFVAVESLEDIFDYMTKERRPNIVISSLPYHQTQNVGMWCIDNEVRYCDLGGRVDVSKAIADHAIKKATQPVFTDLGLAPGWVNIIAEEGYRRVYDATDVKMMVGGIPLHRPIGPLKYFMTWSLDGLLNEYRDDCELLIDGEIKTVAGLSRCETVDPEWDGCVALEAFCTSGGASHTIKSMQRRGVKNCVYKTLRWIGHHALIDFFMNKCNMTDEELKHVLSKSAAYEKSVEDVIVMMVEVKNDTGLTWAREVIVKCDDKFTAMQKATAFSISSVAAIMGEGCFDNRIVQNRGGDIKLPNALTYADIPHEKFNKNLSVLGIK